MSPKDLRARDLTKSGDKETDMQRGAQGERSTVWGSKPREAETSRFGRMGKTIRFKENLFPQLIKAECCNYAFRFHVETTKERN